MSKSSDMGDLVEQGFVFSVLPSTSAKLYEHGIATAIQDLTVPQGESNQVRSESSLEVEEGNISEEVFARLQRSETVVADITGLHPQVLCNVGTALAFKDAKNLILVQSSDENDDIRELPQELQNLAILTYTHQDWTTFSNELQHRLSKTLRAGPAPHPLLRPEHRQKMDRALGSMAKKDWPTAELYLEKLDRELPENWYIQTQWGVLDRKTGDLHGAQTHLDQASRLAVFKEHKAVVFVELAILEAEKKNTAKAEELFNRARRTDSTNRHVYLACADFYDGLGSLERSLEQITGMMQVVGKDDKEAQTRAEYYTRKITQPGFSMAFKAFERQIATRGLGTPGNKPVGRQPSPSPVSHQGIKRVPKYITWHEFKARFTGAVVEGEVNNAHPTMGVFVHLNPELKGLIFHKYAGPDFETRFKPGQEIRVRIRKIYTDQGTRKIDLALA